MGSGFQVTSFGFNLGLEEKSLLNHQPPHLGNVLLGVVAFRVSFFVFGFWVLRSGFALGFGFSGFVFRVSCFRVRIECREVACPTPIMPMIAPWLTV